jgi:hypothetical protein
LASEATGLSATQSARSAKEALTAEEGEAGIAEMSKRFHDKGREITLPAAD